MAAPLGNDFEEWLSKKLVELNSDVDLEIFVSYIQGIFEDDMPEEEQKESLLGILSQIMEDDLETACESIQNKWKSSAVSMKEQQEAAKLKEKEKLDSKLANMMQKQNISVTKTREISAEEKARKATILAQYAQLSDDEDNAVDPGGGDVDKQGAAASSLTQNTNAAAVEQREKEMRDAMKASHESKKQKDKEDREKQKQKAQERKEAEKKRTQKGERRR